MTNHQLQIQHFVFGPFYTNTFVLSDEQHILLIDPACSNQYEHLQLSIVATHGHLDHLWGAKWATEQWNTPVLMHEADIPLAQAMQAQYDLFGIPGSPESFEIKPITNDQLPMTNMSILSTPGHTPGSVCLYFPNEKVLISGDTLFQMGYGRTDLPGGNIHQLIASLDRLFSLPSDVRVYPGHGEFTTIGAERR